MFRKVLFDCKQATFLIVKRQEERISLMQRAKLYYHLFHCSVCRSFNAQSAQITSMFSAFNRKMVSKTPHKLDPETKDSMKDQLDKLIQNKN